MSWVAAGVAAGSIGGALISSKGAGDASKEQSKSTAAAIAEQQRQFDVSRQDQAPYRSAGGAAVQSLQSRLGLFDPDAAAAKAYLAANPDVAADPHFASDPLAHYRQYGQAEGRVWPTVSAPAQGTEGFGDLTKQFTVADFMKDPVTELGMKYGLDLGTKAIDRGAGAAGLRNSGATLKALTRFGQDYAGSKAGESSARFYGDQDRIFNRLSGLAGTGQTATNAGVASGQNYSTNVGNMLTAQGNARGAAAIGQANAYGGALNTVGNYYGQQATLDKILNRGSGTYVGPLGYNPQPE